MELIRKVFLTGFILIIALFICCGFTLIILAAIEFWQGASPFKNTAIGERFDLILEAIGLLTIAVTALELSQTILEEEVIRVVHMSSPTRVRRFLSRFLVVVIVSLSVEALISIFQLSHTDPLKLPHAASIAVSAAFLLIAWGVFVKLNKSGEDIEPEALEAAKSEDHKV